MKLLVSGVALLALSGKPLVLMGRELAIGSSVNARYSVERVTSPERDMAGGAVRASIGTHVVALEDDLPVQDGGTDIRVEGRVRIVVDGREYSHPALANIRPASRDANRYWGYVDLMRLVDRQEQIDQLVVAQNVGLGQFRTVSVAMNGLVTEDRFDYGGRCSPPVRALLIRNVVSHPSGFCSDVMQVWPTIFYPVLYPWISGLLGLVFVLFGGMKVRRRRAGTEKAAGA